MEHARVVQEQRPVAGPLAAEPRDAVRRSGLGRAPGRLSVLVAVDDEVGPAATLNGVAAVLRSSPGVDLEVVVLDHGSPPLAAMTLAAGLLGDDRVRLVRLPRRLDRASARDLAVAASTGEHVLLLAPGSEPRPGWWEPLVAHLADPLVLGVQPLLLEPDDTIRSAGTVLVDGSDAPRHHLVGHPLEDARTRGGTGFAAVSTEALLLRAEDVVALGGLDPRLPDGHADLDLCLRAGELRAGHFAVEPSSLVTRHGPATPLPTLPVDGHGPLLERWRGRSPSAQAPDGRRWALTIAAPGGEKGDRWGDVHFARSLARALAARGQDPVLVRHGAQDVAPAGPDAVALHLRGLDPVRPVDGRVNVVWVISHPEDVDPEELVGVDRVFAASSMWAREMSHRSGRPVEPLLQATDLALRPDRSSPVGDGSRPLFVGNTHAGRPRRIVLDAVAAGVPVEVHGPGWEGVLPDGHLRSAYVANDALMALYRRHGLVLADHWGDMATHGFLANRLFDAVAAGARVVCDDVPGTEALEGAVQVYRTPDELAFLCSPAGRSRWPSDEEMAAIADRVAVAHSFDRRAEQLADAVTALRRA
nr:glycosyltransferase [Nocardioides luti]